MIRIGIYYDGTYFAYVSDYYRYHHPRQARISITGFHEYLRQTILEKESEKDRPGFCQITEAHYYRGRFPADEVNQQKGRLLGERKFDDALARARVITHFPIMQSYSDQTPRERGVNSSLVIDAMEAAFLKKVNVVVLVTGDGDFVPLAARLGAWECRVMVAAWDVQSSDGQITLRTSQELLNVVPYPLLVNKDIDDRSKRNDPFINNLFVTHETEPRVPSRNDHDTAEDTGTDHIELHDVATNDGWFAGTIVNLPPGRDFGFIAPDQGGENLFFHSSWMDERSDTFDTLEVGSRVRFNIGENPRTRQPTATNVHARAALTWRRGD